MPESTDVNAAAFQHAVTVTLCANAVAPLWRATTRLRVAAKAPSIPPHTGGAAGGDWGPALAGCAEARLSALSAPPVLASTDVMRLTILMVRKKLSRQVGGGGALSGWNMKRSRICGRSACASCRCRMLSSHG